MDITDPDPTALPIHYVPGVPALSAAETCRLATIAAQVSKTHPLAGPVQLILTDNTFIRQLNRRYRNLDVATDVLSFELGSGSSLELETVCGELYISLEQARIQAAEQGATVFEELARLLVHGLLHLAGHDHNTPERLSFVESETDRLLQETARLVHPPTCSLPWPAGLPERS